MGTLDIPLVGPGTSIQDALDQMQLLGRSGVVVQRPGDSELLYVGQVLEARDAGLTEVGEIADGVSVLDANSAGVGTAELDLEQPDRTRKAYEKLFRYQPQPFAAGHFLASRRPRTAMVAAAGAGVGASLGTLAAYIGPTTLDLPLMQPENAIDYALGCLSSSKQSVVVVESGNDGLLLPEPTLRECRVHGIRLLGAVSGGFPVPFLSYGEIMAGGLTVTGPHRLDSLFGRYPTHRILAARMPATVRLVTARESLATMLSGSRYRCTGRKPDGQPHYFPSPSVNDGDKCPKWPDCNVDGTHTLVYRIA